MGQLVGRLCSEGYLGCELAGGVDPQGGGEFSSLCFPGYTDAPSDTDAVVDFSGHAAVGDLLRFCVSGGIPAVIATTGHTEEEKALIREAAEKIPVFYASNFSLGVAVLIRAAKMVASSMPGAEIEIIEIHHDRKADAPSGTALTLAEAVREVRPELEITCGRSGMAKRGKNEIGIQSVRIGNVPGIHEVLVGTQSQTITLKHETHDRAVFAEGALTAAVFLKDKPAGLYDMEDLLGR